MPLTKPTIVIFDMDGTAVRHLQPWVLHILERLDDAAYRTGRFFNWLFRRGGKGPILLPQEEEEAQARRRTPRLLVHRALHKVRRKPVEQIVEPCPGLYGVLEFLKQNGVPMALVSNGLGKGYGHDILEKFKLAGYFGATVFREDIRRSKPHPEPLLLGLDRLGISPGTDDVLWYIGDRHKDITAALALAQTLPARVVPIAYGPNAAFAVLEKNVGADHIIMSYFDMLGRLRRLMESEKPPSSLSS